MCSGGWVNEEGGVAVIYIIYRFFVYFVVSLINCGDGVEFYFI